MAVAEPAQHVSPGFGIDAGSEPFNTTAGPHVRRTVDGGSGERPASAARPVTPSGHVIEPAATAQDRNWATMLHLSPLVTLVASGTGIGVITIVIPLVLWLVRREQSVYHDDHGREVINFCLSFVIWHALLIVTIVGALLIPVLWVVALVNLIRGAVAAGQGEYFRYPMTFRLLS